MKNLATFAAMMTISFLRALPLVVCLVMTIELSLCCRRDSQPALRWLTVWAASATLLYAGHYVYFFRSTQLLPLSDTVYAACNLAVYPLYIIYISEHTDLRPLSSRPRLLALLLMPAALALAAVGTLYTLMTPAEQALFFSSYLYGGTTAGLEGLPLLQARVHTACHAVFAAEVVGVLAAGVVKLRRYNITVDSLCADTDDKRLTHLTTTITGLILMSAASFAANYVGRHCFTHSIALLALPSLLFSTLLFFIGWTGRQPHPTLRSMIQPTDTNIDTPTDTKGEAADTDTAELAPGPQQLQTTADIPAKPRQGQANEALLAAQLQRLMDDEKLYLQHDLRLDQVAQRLATNRTYLLRTLQEEFGMTFKEYINDLRIAHADRLMEADPTLPRSDVATMSGYNTTSSFYRNYRQYHKPKQQ